MAITTEADFQRIELDIRGGMSERKACRGNSALRQRYRRWKEQRSGVETSPSSPPSPPCSSLRGETLRGENWREKADNAVEDLLEVTMRHAAQSPSWAAIAVKILTRVAPRMSAEHSKQISVSDLESFWKKLRGDEKK